jgi:hypothetical protein
MSLNSHEDDELEMRGIAYGLPMVHLDSLSRSLDGEPLCARRTQQPQGYTCQVRA